VNSRLTFWLEGSEIMAIAPAHVRRAGRAPARKRGFVGRVGAYLIDIWRRVALSISVGLTALWRIPWLRTWRPTVRQEFVRHCWQVSIKALPTTILTAMIIGIALLFQVIFFRRGEFGDVLGALNINTLVLLTMVREIAPLLVGLIIIGRSATVMISELVDLRTGGQLHMLEAQGIDVFNYLVVSRIAALAVCSFALGVIFVLTALVAGYFMAAIAGVFQIGFFEFLVAATRLLAPTEYLILPLKTLAFGVVIGVITCVTALRPTRVGVDVRELLPLGYMRAVVTTLLLSGAITAMVIL
jgi:phospholipid/cholesterol/gamma-HCH transport system permease protein